LFNAHVHYDVLVYGKQEETPVGGSERKIGRYAVRYVGNARQMSSRRLPAINIPGGKTLW